MTRKFFVSIILLFGTFILYNVQCSSATTSYTPFFSVFYEIPTIANPDSLHFPVKDSTESPLYLKTPSNITETVEYDTEKNEYRVVKKIGDVVLESRALTFEEYQQYDMDNMINSYWKTKTKTVASSSSSSKSDGSPVS